jgi:hypothetical protein
MAAVASSAASPLKTVPTSIPVGPNGRRGSQRAPSTRRERIPHFLAAPNSNNNSPTVAVIGPPSHRHLPNTSPPQPSASPLRPARSHGSPDSPPTYSAAQLASSLTPNNPPSFSLNIARGNQARYVRPGGHTRAQSMQIPHQHMHHHHAPEQHVRRSLCHSSMCLCSSFDNVRITFAECIEYNRAR